MMNEIDFEMEMFDVSVRRLQNGNKLRIVLEDSEDLDLEKQLIEFRGDNVKVKIWLRDPDSEEERDVLEANFEVFDIRCRRLRNGDKLSIILEKMYDKQEELALVKMRADDVGVLMKRINANLPGIMDNDQVVIDGDDEENEVEYSDQEI